MREFVRSMECNQKLINQLGYSCRGRGSSLFDKWTSIRDYETAKKMLSETTIENIADEIGLIGTAYFLAEQCKSVKYHSIAHELESILGDMFYCMGIRNRIQVSILDVKEKKLGYDRSKTVKVFRSDAPEVVLCYITAETTVCDVPKKQAKVAELFDKNVWQQYMKIMEIPYGDDRKQALEKWDTDMDRILQASEMPSGVKDFLFQSDCAGNISRSACMALYERIHNYDNNIAYGFRIVKDSFGNLIRQELGFQDFVELIKECIDTNCDLLWS